MKYLTDTIKTIPGKSSHEVGTVMPASVAFVVFLGEGKEESEYLSIFTLGKSNVVDVAKFYADKKKQLSDSHPKRRFEVLVEFLDGEDSDYSAELDKAFLISDRDNQSLKEEQFDEILVGCKEKNIIWIVSNPAFQLWLLFHFTSDIESMKLDETAKCKDRIAIIEQKLRELSGQSYTHGSIKPGMFSARIDTAITNSAPYCLSVEELKDNTGTNFAELVKYLRNRVHNI